MKLFDLFGCETEETLEEGAVDRQVRRYGSKMKMQYRCKGGAKDGRLAASGASCGIRKDPARVRAGKRSARVKKRERIRKTQFTKRKSLSQVLVRRNKMLRGDAGEMVTKNNPKTKTDNIKASGSEGAS